MTLDMEHYWKALEELGGKRPAKRAPAARATVPTGAGPSPTAPTSLEWRRRKAKELKGGLERRSFAPADVEMREQTDGKLRLTGYASVVETPYEVSGFTETIKRGAFKRTLGEQPDTQLLVNHSGLPLARTKSGNLTLEERDRGLYVDANLDPEDPDVQSLARKMKRGDIDSMSMAFQVTDESWSEDWSQREIRALSLHRGDVSVVNQGANPAATASVRAATTAPIPDYTTRAQQWLDLERQRRAGER